jgi:hypothetical protein
MTLQASGAISISNISVELGLSATSTRSLNDATSRTLAGVASGAISLSSFYGKANAFVFNQTISGNTSNYNLKSSAIAAGWNQVLKLTATITINAGVYVYATSGNYAFATGVTFPTGTTLSVVNNGTIVGYGGAGGDTEAVGAAGGPAILFQYATTVTNNGRIAGGGGGGGGGGSVGLSEFYGNYNVGYNEGIGGAGGGGLGSGGSGSLTAAAGGSAGTGGNDGVCTAIGGTGGTGGSYGAAGASGGGANYVYSSSTASMAYLNPPGGGGAAGIATNTRASTGSTITGGTVNGANT